MSASIELSIQDSQRQRLLELKNPDDTQSLVDSTATSIFATITDAPVPSERTIDHALAFDNVLSRAGAACLFFALACVVYSKYFSGQLSSKPSGPLQTYGDGLSSNSYDGSLLLKLGYVGFGIVTAAVMVRAYRTFR